MPSGSVVAIKRAIKVDNTTFLIGKNGKLYCDRLTTTKGCYLLTLSRWAKFYLRALSKLGVVTRKDAEDHLDACLMEQRRNERSSSVHEFLVAAHRINLRITSSQRKFLKKARA
jgi:hypothetical protein